MEQDDDKPIAREPWQGLLGERDAAPSQLTDARIRAAARRALKPRVTRWWLPASLAASVVLAVVLVQLQFGETPPPLMTESDVVAPEIQTAPADAAAPAVDLPAEYAADPPVVAPSRQSAPEAQVVAPPAIAPAAAPVQKAAREREEVLLQDAAVESRRAAPAQVAPAQAATPRASGSLGALKELAAEPRSPEDWYADIEALRAAGRHEEADAELERLEAAWPGWLEKNRAQPR